MNKKILTLRNKINKTDKKILRLLEKRFNLTNKVGEIKKEQNIKVKDNTREKQLFKNRITQTKLNKKFVTELFTTILKESRRLQK